MNKSTAPRSPLLVVAIQLGLLIVVTYYTFIGGQTAQGIYDHTWRLVTLWFSTFLIGSWLLWRIIGSRKIPRTPLDWPLLSMLLAWSLATIFSVNVTYSLETVVFFIIYLFFFYLTADLGRRSWFTELLFNAIIAASGLVWTLALLQLSWWYQDQMDAGTMAGFVSLSWLQRLERLPRLSVLGNPNTMASYIALVIPITLYKLMSARTFVARLLLGLWVVMLSGAIFLTQSRGGVLALIVSVVFYLGVVALQRGGQEPLRRMESPSDSGLLQLRRRRVWVIALAVVTMSGFFTWSTLASRGLQEGMSLRQQVIAGAFKAWTRRPVLGAGPGTLGEQLLRYQQPLDAVWADAHNLYLTLLAETGLVGAAGLLWLAVVVLKMLWSTFRNVDRNKWALGGMSCVAALLGFATHNMVDSLFKFPLIMLLVAILAGCWVGSYLASSVSSGPDPGRRSWGYPAMAAAGVLLTLNTAVGLRTIQNIKVYNQAVEAAGRNDWSAALDYMRSAQQAVPRLSFYRQQLGFTLGYLAGQEETYRTEAIHQYSLALQDMDRLALSHANLGCLLAGAEQWPAARHEMSLAQGLRPGDPMYRLNLGYYFEMEGDDVAAREAYATVLARRPDYVQSSYWSGSNRRAKAMPDIVEQTIEVLSGADPAAWLPLIHLYLDLGRVDDAWQTYEAAKDTFDPATRHREKGRILLAMDRLVEAQTALETALQFAPESWETHLYLSKVALARDQAPKATSHAAHALLLRTEPRTLFQSAAVAAARGDRSTAIQQYDDAFMQIVLPVETELSRYATEVARRRPLPTSFLPCLIQIYPTGLLVAITEAEGDLLEQQGELWQAAGVYRRLLQYEPGVSAIQIRLDRLCEQQSEICASAEN